MINLIKISIGGLVFLAIPFFASAQTSEQILNYHSDIQIHADSSMTVTENIKVISTGDQIRRGIYRDFPIAYRDAEGRRYFVGFDLLEVTRNGLPEPYHTERSGNGQRIYIGEEDVFIPNGEHEYSIKYKTTRQLGFFENHDELYWNVTGNGWVFPIASATARIVLPQNVPAQNITANGYTGMQGSTAQDVAWQIKEDGVIEFVVTRPLATFEGLTIVVGWPKGVVEPPSEVQNFWAMVWANMDYIFGLFSLLLVAAYYVYMWRKVGKDPKKGIVIALYEPPRGYSPAFLSYVKRMGAGGQDFASAIINLGVKRLLSVVENKKNGLFSSVSYTLNKQQDTASQQPALEEQILYDQFFAHGDSFELKKADVQSIVKIKNKFETSLKEQASKTYFHKNTGAIVGGVALTVGAVVGTMIFAAMVRYDVQTMTTVVFWSAFAIIMLVINVGFGLILSAYTVAGRKLIDEIEGFKLFLTVTEKDRLAFHNPPEQTPALFEKMLPYALALGVEHEWAEQFASVFARLQDQGVSYAPMWYHGSLSHFTPTAFASEVGNSFTGVVASASTPPGSSSGGSGGMSGGGGGGGGGGGW